LFVSGPWIKKNYKIAEAMKYKKGHIITEPLRRFNGDNNISLLSPFMIVSFLAAILIIFVGCSTNYQGPLRFSGNSQEQNYQKEYNRYKSSNSHNSETIEYIIDTLIVIDTVVEECPLENNIEFDQNRKHESCPVIFDTTTTGDRLAEAEFILRDYLIDLLPGSVFYKKYISELIDRFAVYLPDILDYILELLGLDKIIEKQRYPEVYISLSSNGVEVSEQTPGLSSVDSGIRRGFDIVQ